MSKRITIAVDGYSSCGKSTIARHLAAALGYVYVDTGAMYRAVTLFALRNKLFRDDHTIDQDALQKHLDEIKITFEYNPSTQRSDTFLGNENVEAAIRGMEVSASVSQVAAVPFVRAAMVVRQRAIGADKGVVMDGRDIGTTVFPDAELKIFVTAADEVRAQRRYDELRAKGMAADLNDILNNIRQRDYLDTHRQASPLRQAPDAILLDNSHMAIAEQDRWAEQQARAIIDK